MRKTLLKPILFIFLGIACLVSEVASAEWKDNTVVNQTTHPVTVIYSTWRGASRGIPSGYRTRGYFRVSPGKQRRFQAWANNRIYFLIQKDRQTIKPHAGTETLSFWVHPNLDFTVVSQQLNSAVPRTQLTYTSRPATSLTHQDGFMRYNNGARITVTENWRPVPSKAALNAPVNIPDPNLRAAIEKKLGKTSGAAITQADMLKLTALDPEESRIENLTGLEFATNLWILDLWRNNLSDVSPLENLTKLQKLTLSVNNLSDVSPLENLTNLTHLYLGENNLSDVSPLENLTNLRYLSLGGNNLSDVSPLEKLKTLRELRLNDNNISDVSPLANLTNLTKLYLHSNEIADFSPILGVILKLKKDPFNRYTDHNQRVESVGPPINIPDPTLRAFIERGIGKESGAAIRKTDMLKLTEIYAARYAVEHFGHQLAVENLTGLEFATNLSKLDLGDNNISDISPLKNLRNLLGLDLNGNNISDISPLKNLRKLRKLDLDGNNISDISPLKNLTDLVVLYLDGNNISDISPLKNLTKLQTLFLRNNKISDFSPIAGLIPNLRNYTDAYQRDVSVIRDPALLSAIRRALLTTDAIRKADLLKLTRLAARDVEDLTGLEFATNLSELYLNGLVSRGGNNLSDISRLKNLRNLQRLQLNANNISDISPLKNLTKLTDLYLNANNISDISPLKNLRNLLGLELDDNNISDISPLKNLRKLRKLDLDGNNISDISPLKNLTDLVVLHLNDNNISDISPLKNLTGLDKLMLAFNRISDFSPIAGVIPNLRLYYPHHQRYSCGTVISTDTPPLDAVKVTPLLVNKTIAPKDGVSIGETKAAVSAEGGRNRAWTTYDTVATDEQEKFSLVLTIEFLDGETFREERKSVERAFMDWAKNSNIAPKFVSSGKSDIRVKFNNTKKGDWHVLSENVGAPLGDRNAHWNSNKYTMYLTTDFTYGTALHEVGHALGLLHEHLSPNFEKNFKWKPGLLDSTDQRYQTITRKFVYSESDRSLFAKPDAQLTTKEHARKAEVKASIDFNFFDLRKIDEKKSYFDIDSVMTYGLSSELIEVRPNADAKIKQAFQNKGGIPDNDELSDGDRKFIAQCYGPALHRAQLNGDVHIDGIDDETGKPNRLKWNSDDGWWWKHDTINERKTIAPYIVTHHWVFSGKQVAVFKWGGECRVQVYVSTREITDTHVEAAVTALLYEGTTDRTDDLEDITCWDVNIPFGTPSKIELDLENTTGMKIDARTAQCKDVVLNYSDSGFSPDLGGEGDKATVTVTLSAFRVSPSAYASAAPSLPMGRITSLSETTRRDLFSDVNADGRVDVADLILISNMIGQSAFGDPHLDINRDGIITIADLVYAAQYLGQSREAAAPTRVVVPEGLAYKTVQGWIDHARLEDDGTAAFREGIAKLQYLLTLIIPEKTALLHNYPNPFNPETWIPYHLAEPAEVTLTIYAIDGTAARRLDLGHQAAGYYQSKTRAAYWDGRNSVGERVASGVYFYTLTAGDFSATGKMLIMK